MNPKVPKPFIDAFGPWVVDASNYRWIRYKRPGANTDVDGTLVLIYILINMSSRYRQDSWYLARMSRNDPVMCYKARAAKLAVRRWIADMLEKGDD